MITTQHCNAECRDVARYVSTVFTLAMTTAKTGFSDFPGFPSFPCFSGFAGYRLPTINYKLLSPPPLC